MIKDIVVDTNVFVHACNPEVTYYHEAKKLMTVLKHVLTVLRVDEGFNIDEAQNRSLICNEYLKHLHFGMLGYAVLVELASTGRVIPVTRSVTPADAKRINRIIPHPRDRVFLKVAINSEERFLTSHDFGHFPSRTRAEIKSIFEVCVKTADEALVFLMNESLT